MPITANRIENYLSLTEIADELLFEANRKLDRKRKTAMGQFMTPSAVGQFMASLFANASNDVRLLDAGAGVGSLSAALVQRCCEQVEKPRSITVVAYELEPVMLPFLREMVAHCNETCAADGIVFHADVLAEDFIRAGQCLLEESLFSPGNRPTRFTHAILNPPYKKIRSDGEHRLLLRSIGIETVNLYAAFVAIALKMLDNGGELVAITPRSFCNGPYFKPFRQMLLDAAAIRRIHVFESRNKAFAHDEVLQENIIFHLVKGGKQDSVLVSSSEEADLTNGMTLRHARFEEIVKPDDPDLIIHVTTHEDAASVERRIKRLPCTLKELGIEVSTGPVVDFRLRDHLRMEPEDGTVPLIYPQHCEQGVVVWPRVSRKANAISDNVETRKWLFPNGCYTLVRRFSSKEERRRIVATVHDPQHVPGEFIGFENHLNLFHAGRKGLSCSLARGLAVYLNSTLVDEYFRQYSGHTQVNASDLRMLRYPSRELLERWGKKAGKSLPSQEEIDKILEGAVPDE